MRKKYCENAVILTDLAVFAIAFICSLLIRYRGEARHVLFDYNYSQNIGVLFLYLILYLLIIFAVRGTGGYKLGRNIPEQIIYVVRNQGTLLMIIILFAFTTRNEFFQKVCSIHFYDKRCTGSDSEVDAETQMRKCITAGYKPQEIRQRFCPFGVYH